MTTYNLRRLICLLTMCLMTHAVSAQDVDEFLRQRIEQLRETGSLQIDGNAIAAITLIPELYERRGFTPTWTRPLSMSYPPAVCRYRPWRCRRRAARMLSAGYARLAGKASKRTGYAR